MRPLPSRGLLRRSLLNGFLPDRGLALRCPMLGSRGVALGRGFLPHRRLANRSRGLGSRRLGLRIGRRDLGSRITLRRRLFRCVALPRRLLLSRCLRGRCLFRRLRCRCLRIRSGLARFRDLVGPVRSGERWARRLR